MIDSMPAGDPKHPLPFPFGSLSDDEFDLIVYLLAEVRIRRLRRSARPTAASTPSVPPMTIPWSPHGGVQAKLHREQIKWPDCKRSLDRAVAVWHPPKITFAFPRDLTLGQHKLFRKHLTDRHPRVEVDWWGASKLTALLLESPAGRGIAKRFFNTEDPLTSPTARSERADRCAPRTTC